MICFLLMLSIDDFIPAKFIFKESTVMKVLQFYSLQDK